MVYNTLSTQMIYTITHRTHTQVFVSRVVSSKASQYLFSQGRIWVKLEGSPKMLARNGGLPLPFVTGERGHRYFPDTV